MKAVLTKKNPNELKRGELRRVPQDKRGGLIGLHFCCPLCGFVTVAINGRNGMFIAEHRQGNTMTFSATLTCTYCKSQIKLHEGDFNVVETADVLKSRHS